jgi:hypothetical protein
LFKIATLKIYQTILYYLVKTFPRSFRLRFNVTIPAKRTMNTKEDPKLMMRIFDSNPFYSKYEFIPDDSSSPSSGP